jgi:AI-2 transport system permease protein
VALQKLLWKLGNQREFTLLIFIGILLGIFALTTPTMLSGKNMMDLLQNMVVICLLTFGMITVIIARGIDLSIGAIMGYVTLLVGKLAVAGWPLWALIAAGLIAGLIAGALNGLLVTVVKLPPIIATLGTLSIYSGLMYIITNGQWITNLPKQLIVLGKFEVWGIPGRMVILAVILLVMVLVLQFSVFGRYIYAVGNNPNAAKLAGIPEAPVVFITYLIAGLCAALAGILYVSYTGFTTPTTGIDMQMKAIAAAVICGTSVFGGRGTPIGGILGSFLLVIIASCLVFYHLPAIWNKAAEGLIILIAVVSDSMLVNKTRKLGGR